ncbi:myeloid leukemia factor [Salix suchowensis]|nr:myeloid leukemia factor [Salix suchowensis]
MQRERQGRNDLFAAGDPFVNFQGFGMMPGLFGGRDPFDDPFFTRHLVACWGLVGLILPVQLAGRYRRQIEERLYDHQKHIGSNKEPSVEHPDDYPDDRENKTLNYRSDYNQTEGTEPRVRSSSFQTCKVTYGGIDGAYYTSTRARRTGSDGLLVEESKEADKTTGQATHRISRGINDKGHSVTRKLNSDGKVDTTQTLHNLNEGLTWKLKGQLPSGWSDHFDMHGNRGSEQNGMDPWSLGIPSTKQTRNAGGMESGSEPGTNALRGRTKKVVRINIE